MRKNIIRLNENMRVLLRKVKAKEKINLPLLVMGGTSGWKKECWEEKGDWICNEALMNGSSTLAAITQGLSGTRNADCCLTTGSWYGWQGMVQPQMDADGWLDDAHSCCVGAVSIY